MELITAGPAVPDHAIGGMAVAFDADARSGRKRAGGQQAKTGDPHVLDSRRKLRRSVAEKRDFASGAQTRLPALFLTHN
jgi:hypothetical protein